MGYFFIIILVVIIVYFWTKAENNNSASNLGIILHEKAIYLEGIGDLEPGINVNIFCYYDKIGFDTNKYRDGNPITHKELSEKNYFDNTTESKDSYQLYYSKINKVEVKKVSKMTDKEKSILGRGIAGAVIGGGAGAVVGGMTGVKDKKTQSDFMILSIIYTNKDNQEKIAKFASEYGRYIFFRKLPETIANKIGQTEDL
ncbi:MAG: hypothetical protein GX387_06185, partial [Clostridium sp.]|nr:hypothetical protein [Clostridium sp.]